MRQRVDVIFDSQVTVLSKILIQEVCKSVLVTEQIAQYDLNVVFVDATCIQKLNRDYLNKNRETDVIAFPLSDATSDILEGEIYICTDVARQQAREYHVRYKNELLRLVIHGILHLIGYDDQTDEARMKMHEMEDKFLSRHFAI